MADRLHTGLNDGPLLPREPLDAWRPGSPSWVSHQALQEENCQLRNQWDALLAALDALVLEMQEQAKQDGGAKNRRGMRTGYQWANRLAAVIAIHREPT